MRLRKRESERERASLRRQGRKKLAERVTAAGELGRSPSPTARGRQIEKLGTEQGGSRMNTASRCKLDRAEDQNNGGCRVNGGFREVVGGGSIESLFLAISFRVLNTLYSRIDCYSVDTMNLLY